MSNILAYQCSGSEECLRSELRKLGAKVIRTRPAYVRGKPELVQLHVRMADGTLGYFSPGGPPETWTYRWVPGEAPGDRDLPGCIP